MNIIIIFIYFYNILIFVHLIVSSKSHSTGIVDVGSEAEYVLQLHMRLAVDYLRGNGCEAVSHASDPQSYYHIQHVLLCKVIITYNMCSSAKLLSQILFFAYYED